MGADDMKELKEDIAKLDKKLDKNEENMNRRLEKNEENMNKFMETTSVAINKLTEVINDIKIIMIKDYCEKCDLEKVEMELVNKIDECNNNRKSDIKELNDKVDSNIKETNDKFRSIEKNGSVSFNDILRYVFFILVSSGVTYLVVK